MNPNDPNVAMMELVAERLGERLRERGFVNDSSRDAPIRRWRAGGVTVDALPGHLPGDAASQARLPDLEDKLRQLAELD